MIVGSVRVRSSTISPQGRWDRQRCEIIWLIIDSQVSVWWASKDGSGVKSSCWPQDLYKVRVILWKRRCWGKTILTSSLDVGLLNPKS